MNQNTTAETSIREVDIACRRLFSSFKFEFRVLPDFHDLVMFVKSVNLCHMYYFDFRFKLIGINFLRKSYDQYYFFENNNDDDF